MPRSASPRSTSTDPAAPGRELPWLGRGAVALVWLYQGLWCKLLAGREEHEAVVRLVPGLSAASGLALSVLGLLEVALAFWVLSRWRPRLAASAQAALLVAMNSGGLLWARDAIGDPAGMVVHNIALLALAWTVARLGDLGRDDP
ncbi:MAG: DoxX-like family protein [Planctomycetes bacterium]|nr:DoxX-like family protein [Planctomycetota bacterium]